MKILYLTETNICKESGITRKISFQIRCWEAFGAEVKLVSMHSLEKGDDYSLDPKVNQHAMVLFNKKLKFFKNYQIVNYLNKIWSFKKIRNLINRFTPDIIYYRQGTWFPGLTSLLTKNSATIMEVNTLDMYELEHYPTIRRLIYSYGREKIINAVSGIIAVSNEINYYYKNYKKPIEVISNGYVFNKKIEQKRRRSNKKPNLIFVGTPDLPWHGEDKIMYLAKKIPEFTFHIVGIYPKEKLTENVIIHGYLDKNSLFSLYKNMDIGIGTLALHRKQMEEASPLKTREYAAFGLPMILGYEDTDLKGCDFVLEIGNYEENISNNIERIINFVNTWKNKSLDYKTLHKALDQKNKEKKRIEFFKRIVDET